MTWTETAPGVHEASGRACRLTVSKVRPEDPYRWRVELDFGLHSPLVSAAGEHAGTVESAKVYALGLIHNLGHNLSSDAASLAGSMTRALTGTRSPAPEVG